MAAVKVRVSAHELAFSPANRRIELAGAVQRVKLVAAADMEFADENLREGRTRAGAIATFAGESAGSAA